MTQLLAKLSALFTKLSILLGFPPDPKPIVPIDHSIPPPAHISRIPIWAEGIKHAEGWAPTSRSYQNNNPGNLKASSYTLSLGATGKDSGNFCVFPDEQTGMKALRQFLTDAARNELIPYKNATLAQFTTTYAQPPSNLYITTVCSYLKVAPTIKISELL